MAGPYKNILYEKEGKVVVITINRPESMNAIDMKTSGELFDAWSDFRDDPDLWVAILTGSGDKAFSAGADLKELGGASGGEGEVQMAPFGGITKDIEIFKPMIAAINGYALGGGLEMALACDLRIVAEHATFTLPEIRWNLIPGAGGLFRLPRSIPLAKAMELVLMGERITAHDAFQWGLVNKVVSLDKLMPTAMEWANKICEKGPLAVRASKECVIRGLEKPLKDVLHLDDEYLANMFQTEDLQEGLMAFMEKRKPVFKGK